MRFHQVQPGDSPASIAATFAGCPKCARDLVASNPDKPTILYPNGYETFVSLEPGETLQLPEKWFDGTLDTLPRSYFEALPSADGGLRGAKSIRGERALWGLAGVDLNAAAGNLNGAIAGAQGLPGNFQATVDAQQSGGEAAAVSAMTGMLTSGFDPNNSADDQALITIAAGAMTAAGFPELGAALLLLDALAPVFFAALKAVGLPVGPAACQAPTPAATTADMLASWGYPWPSTAPFARVAVPILAKYSAAFVNCQNPPPSALVLMAVAKLWNSQGSGAAQPVFVPALFGGNAGYAPAIPSNLATQYGWPAQPFPTSALPLLGASVGTSGGFTTVGAAAANGVSTSVLPWAFEPAASLPQAVIDAADADPLKASVLVEQNGLSLNGGPALITVGGPGAPVYTPPKTGGSASGASSSSSGIVPIVVGAAAVGAGALWLYSYLTHQAFSEAARTLWRKVKTL